MKPLTWTPPLLVNWIKTELENKGMEGNLRLEAELLVAFGLEIDRIEIYLQFDRPLNESERAKLRALVRRRFQNEPIAYILGDAHFWDLTLLVGKGVLIPRSDSETLVEYLVDRYPGGQPIRALEFGFGSGAISLSWATSSREIHIEGLDISPEAFHYANLNLESVQAQLESNHSTVKWHLNKRLSEFSGPYEVLVSNPPYLSVEEMKQLPPAVKDHEPHLALAGGPDGLDFYRLLFDEGLRLLAPTGTLVVEHGFEQKAGLLQLKPPGFSLVCAKQDLSHRDRVLVFQKET